MKQGDVDAAERMFKRIRSSVQVQEGRESREQSSSPTLLTRTESPEVQYIKMNSKLAFLLFVFFFRS